MASNEALDVLHRAMRLASYRRVCMAIEITSDLPTFLSSPISLSPTTIANKHSNSQFKLKPSYIIVLKASLNLIVCLFFVPARTLIVVFLLIKVNACLS